MGVWISRPELEDGETVLAEVSANRSQGKRAVGGRLFMTDRHLRFVANRFDRRLGGQDISVPRGSIESAAVADRSLDGGPFTGGARRRLAVTAPGGTELFVVNRVDEVAAQVQAWAADG